jgi:putative flippase GtrA
VLLPRFGRFVLVGGVATVVQYALLIALVRFVGADPVWASTAGFLVSAVVNYLGNYHYTFRSRRDHGGALLRFAILAGVGLLLNAALMRALVLAGWHYLLAQIVVTALVLLWNFIGNSVWTFGGDSVSEERPMRESLAALQVWAARNRDLIAVVALTAAVRAAVCLLTDNEAGDADMRAVMAAEWAHAPNLILSGTWLPLHFYATGVLCWVFGSPIAAGKALSLVTGSLTVVPLFLLTQQLFDRRTAVVAGLYFAIYGLHVGLSSVVMSEAPCAFFMVWGVQRFFAEIRSDPPRLGGLLAAAALLAIAGGFRQEPWQLTGILALYLLWLPRTRWYAVPFGIVGLSSFALWDIANAVADQGWLHALTAVAHAKAGETRIHHFSAAHNLLKWVWEFVRSPGPIISLLTFAGLGLAVRRRLPWDLALVAALLIAPYVFISVIKTEWAPQDRYTVFFVILVLPYAAAATVASFQESTRLRQAAAAVVVLSVVSQGLAYLRWSHLLLPVRDYNANDEATWKWLAANAGGAALVVVEDTDWRAPGLVAHAALYNRYRMIYTFNGPEALHKWTLDEPRPLMLVLHSPLSKWSFLGQLDPTPVFQNEDYRILIISRSTPGQAARVD